MPPAPWRLKTRAEELARASGFASIVDGRQDALRHLIGSALFARAYGAFAAWAAGVVLEWGSWAVGHNTAAQRDMDLHNNAVGRTIAREASSEEDVVRRARRALDDGSATWIAEEPAVDAGDLGD